MCQTASQAGANDANFCDGVEIQHCGMLQKLEGYRKLTNPNEMMRLRLFCNKPFTVNTSTKSAETPVNPSPLIAPSPPIPQSSGSPVKTRQSCGNCTAKLQQLRSVIKQKDETLKNLRRHIRTMTCKMRPMKRLNEIIKRRDATIHKLKQELHSSNSNCQKKKTSGEIRERQQVHEETADAKESRSKKRWKHR